MPYIDLTQTFTSDMPVYPGDPASELYRIDAGGVVDHELKTAMHVGTHMDAPLHMIPDGKYLSDYGAERFCGRGVIIDARGEREAGIGKLGDCEIGKSDVVLVCFGWGSKFRDADYYQQHPEFTESFAERLAELGPTIVGMDTPSPDRPPFRIHKILLRKDILIVENLANLEMLVGKKDFEIIALPAKLHAEAAPCRVIAKF